MSEVMKIRIVKASSPTFWYVNSVGEVFDVKETLQEINKHVLTYRFADGQYGAVSFEDCEEVIEHNSQIYRKVDRPVQEGDTVLITRYNGELIHDVEEVSRLGICDDRNFYFGYGNYLEYGYDEYFVLELVKQSQPTWDEIGERIHADLEAKLLQAENESHSYAEVSELLHEAKEETKTVTLLDLFIAGSNAWFESVTKKLDEKDDVIEHSQNELVEFNGKQYRKVKRKAAVGELVHVFGHVQKAANGIYEVERVERFPGEDECIKYGGGWGTPYWDGNAYETLELVEQSGQTELDLIANLAQEVAELKRQLTDAKTDIADLEDRVDENEKDTEEVIGRINDLGDGAEAAAVVPTVDFDNLIGILELKLRQSAHKRSKYSDIVTTAKYFSGKSAGLKEAIAVVKEALRNG